MVWGQKEGRLAAISAAVPLVASFLPAIGCFGVCTACGGCVSVAMGTVIMARAAIAAHKAPRRTKADGIKKPLANQ